MRKYLFSIIGLVVVFAIASAGYVGYRYLENEKKEVELARIQKEQEQNTPLNRIKAELAKNRWTSGVINVDLDESTGVLTITDDSEPSGGLNQSDGLGQGVGSMATPEEILQQTYNMYVRAGQAVFKIDGVKSLVVLRKVPVNRGTGIVTQTEVALIKISKEKFLAVDWDSFEGKIVHNIINETADTLNLDTGFVRTIRNVNLLILLPNFK